MRRLTQAELKSLKYLSSVNIEVALIEPTQNGLNKSILDATESLRYLLRTTALHDFKSQSQGPDHKVSIQAHLLNADDELASVASLYRPMTKKGDPRIWFSNLRSYASPGDILAIAILNGHLWVLNLTSLNLEDATKSNTLVSNFFEEYTSKKNNVAEELLLLMKTVAAKGFIPGTVNADTAIGRLLEQELKIPINSNQTPDYKGIEIKSFRAERNNRKNLFAQVPSWEISKFKSSKQILDAFGYEREGKKKLYCTVSCIKYNSQGLRLELQPDFLIEMSQNPEIGHFIGWRLEKLRQRLLEKHAETFWVSANTKIENGREYFHFTKIEHTKGPLVTNLELLLELGKITVDHLIKERGSSAVEKGPIFKLDKNSLDVLFPASETYDLLA